MTNSDGQKREALGLIEKALAGELTLQEKEDLQQRLVDDDAFALEYLEYFQLEADLSLIAHEDRVLTFSSGLIDGPVKESSIEEHSRTTSPADRPPRNTRCDSNDKTMLTKVYCFFAQPTPLSMSVAATVLGLLITAMAFMAPPFYRALTRVDDDVPSTQYDIVAELTEMRDVVWLDAQSKLHRGAFLLTGQRLELESGLIEIAFRDGTRMKVEGPASFEIDASRVDLDHGHLVAHVPEGAIGFEVVTPVVRVIDLGTEFGVAQGDQGAGEVYVFEGAVQLRSLRENSTSEPVLLNAGQGVKWDASGRFGDQKSASRERFADLSQPLGRDMTVLFYDNFNADDTTSFDSAPLVGRRGGLLGEEVVMRSARTQQHISQNQWKTTKRLGRSGRLRFEGSNDSQWYDWAAGSTGETIAEAGTLRIDFDWTAPDTTSSDWISFSIGHPGLTYGEPGLRVTDPETDYGIQFFANGQTRRYDNGDGRKIASFRPSLNRHHVVIELKADSFADGKEAEVTVMVSGKQVHQYTFEWDNNAGQLFMELGSLESGMLIDNLRLSAVGESNANPQPSN